MNAPVKITAILGTYRKNGVIDRAVDEILDAARTLGAKKTDTLFIGLAAGQPHQDLGDRDKTRARQLGKKLAQSQIVVR